GLSEGPFEVLPLAADEAHIDQRHERWNDREGYGGAEHQRDADQDERHPQVHGIAGEAEGTAGHQHRRRLERLDGRPRPPEEVRAPDPDGQTDHDGDQPGQTKRHDRDAPPGERKMQADHRRESGQKEHRRIDRLSAVPGRSVHALAVTPAQYCNAALTIESDSPSSYLFRTGKGAVPRDGGAAVWREGRQEGVMPMSPCSDGCLPASSTFRNICGTHARVVGRAPSGPCAAGAVLSAFFVLVLVSQPAASSARAATSDPAPTMHLAAGDFHPLDPASLPAPGWFRAPSFARSVSERRYLVAIGRGPLDAEARARVESAGAEILDYFPDNGYRVRLAPDSEDALRALPFFAWIGELPAHAKVEPALAARAQAEAH